MNSISHLVRINKSSAAVFSALTENTAIEQWFTTTKCDVWREGEVVTWFGNTTMTISRMISNHSIALQVETGSGWEGTEIWFEVEPLDDERSLVRFDHHGWQDVTDHFRDCSMSWAYFLESLRLFLETGVGTPENDSPACEST